MACKTCQRHSWCFAVGQTLRSVLISNWSLSNRVNSRVILWALRADIQFTKIVSLVCGGAFGLVTMNRYKSGKPSPHMSTIPPKSSILLLLVLTTDVFSVIQYRPLKSSLTH